MNLHKTKLAKKREVLRMIHDGRRDECGKLKIVFYKFENRQPRFAIKYWIEVEPTGKLVGEHQSIPH